MPLLGAHMSIAGGYHKAVEAAQPPGATACNCSPRTTTSGGQRRSTDDEADRFQASLTELGISHPIAHDSYLINLASPDDELWKKSIDALVVELERAEKLGIPYVVAHPGAFTTSSEKAGLRRIARGARRGAQANQGHCGPGACWKPPPGRGRTLVGGSSIWPTIIDEVRDPDRLGVCFDTCHVFAAGYPMETKQEYLATMRELDRTVGRSIGSRRFTSTTAPSRSARGSTATPISARARWAWNRSAT